MRWVETAIPALWFAWVANQQQRLYNELIKNRPRRQGESIDRVASHYHRTSHRRDARQDPCCSYAKKFNRPRRRRSCNHNTHRWRGNLRRRVHWLIGVQRRDYTRWHDVDGLRHHGGDLVAHWSGDCDFEIPKWRRSSNVDDSGADYQWCCVSAVCREFGGIFDFRSISRDRALSCMSCSQFCT